MAYTAEITDKRVYNGALTVSIRYKSGEIEINETATIREAQPTGWVKGLVARRIKELNALDDFNANITLAPVAIDDVIKEPPVNTARDEYALKLADLKRYVSAQRLGIVTAQHGEFVALRKWLSDNFQAAYIDLFI